MAQLTVFEHAFLIDGHGGDPLADAWVAVEGATIQEVGTGIPALSGDVTRIDLRGKTLMPGLIDAHVHAGNVELRLHDTVQLPPAVYVHRVTRTLETDLQMGFTSLRDAGGLDAGFRQAIELGLIRGPRLFLSITPLNQSGTEVERPGFGPQPPTPRNSLGICPEVCDGPDAVRRAVRRAIGRGADQIKMFADGEVVAQTRSDRTAPGHWKFSVEELRTAVETAASFGSYVFAHTYSHEAIRNCALAGVRSVEHGNLLTEETAAILVETGTYLVPTLTVYELLTGDAATGLDAHSREKLKIVGDKGLQALETAWRAGVTIGSGSDIIGPWQERKGRELAIKAEVMGASAAITSATRTNAELMGVGDRLGTVSAGKFADLIVVDGNPLREITLFEDALRRVPLVMIGGRIAKNCL